MENTRPKKWWDSPKEMPMVSAEPSEMKFHANLHRKTHGLAPLPNSPVSPKTRSALRRHVRPRPRVKVRTPHPRVNVNVRNTVNTRPKKWWDLPANERTPMIAVENQPSPPTRSALRKHTRPTPRRSVRRNAAHRNEPAHMNAGNEPFNFK